MCFLLLLEDEEAEEEQHVEEYEDVKEIKKKEKVAKSKRFVIMLESMFMQLYSTFVHRHTNLQY